jgi:hypothetical protein
MDQVDNDVKQIEIVIVEENARKAMDKLKQLINESKG